MRRHLCLKKRNGLFASGFAQITQTQARALACLHGRVTLEVRQSEVARAVATVGGAQQGKQRRVLADRQELTIAEGPTFGSKSSCKNSDFGNKWIRHKLSFSATNSARGRSPATR